MIYGNFVSGDGKKGDLGGVIQNVPKWLLFELQCMIFKATIIIDPSDTTYI